MFMDMLRDDTCLEKSLISLTIHDFLVRSRMNSFEVVADDGVIRRFRELHLHRTSFIHFFLERCINILIVKLVLQLSLTFSLVDLFHAWDQLLLTVKILINGLHHANLLLFSTCLTINFNSNSVGNIPVLLLHNWVNNFTSTLRRIRIIILNTWFGSFILWWAIVINRLHETLVEHAVASSSSSDKLTRFQIVILVLYFLNVLLSFDTFLSQFRNLIFEL